MSQEKNSSNLDIFLQNYYNICTDFKMAIFAIKNLCQFCYSKFSLIIFIFYFIQIRIMHNKMIKCKRTCQKNNNINFMSNTIFFLLKAQDHNSSNTFMEKYSLFYFIKHQLVTIYISRRMFTHFPTGES